MTRCVLTDDSGKWFDISKAVKFDEEERFDGNNCISCATGSQWEHEALYYTKSGNWVLNSWSQWQGSVDSYEQISEEAAIQWLISQERWEDKGLAKLPAEVQSRVKAGMESAEV